MKRSVSNGWRWVQIDLGRVNHDHKISSDERLGLVVARQQAATGR